VESGGGVVVRHGRRCGLRAGEDECSCSPAFQAQVWSPRDRRPLRKTFPTVAEAVAWRQAALEWLALAEQGVVRTRSGDIRC
jgi:hypothetical protein